MKLFCSSCLMYDFYVEKKGIHSIKLLHCGVVDVGDDHVHEKIEVE